VKTINLIGCGRVGKVLARLWHTQGSLLIQDVLTTSLASAQSAVAFIGAGHAVARLQDMRWADFWLIAVPDRSIADVANVLAQTWPSSQAARQIRSQDTPQATTSTGAITAFHASGALTAAELSPLEALGWQIASAHCILSFANPDTALQQINGTPCALQGHSQALDTLRSLFATIGLKPFVLAAEHKMLYHAAAVFATNFLPVLQHTAEQLWHETGMPAEQIAHLRQSLLTNSVDNLLTLGPQGALTGPASRGDSDLVQRQAQAVGEWSEPTGRAYVALSEMVTRLAAQLKPMAKRA
jgi:predicted short-subunit dehydrogenase-like oxidoreductase (DUF2520 family)